MLMEWDKLSMKDRAGYIRAGVSNGLYGLEEIKNAYNRFNSDKPIGGISDEQYYSTMERVAKDNYKAWKFKNEEQALIHALNDNAYDYRGFYNKYPNSAANAETHWTDEFKTVYHPTFSKQSIYSGKKSQYNPKGITGGSWAGEYFMPSLEQIADNRFDLGGYFTGKRK